MTVVSSTRAVGIVVGVSDGWPVEACFSRAWGCCVHPARGLRRLGFVVTTGFSSVETRGRLVLRSVTTGSSPESTIGDAQVAGLLLSFVSWGSDSVVVPVVVIGDTVVFEARTGVAPVEFDDLSFFLDDAIEDAVFRSARTGVAPV